MLELWSNLILNIKAPRVVTLIGGGGKTSLMYYLVAILKSKGYNAIATTTTKLCSQQLRGHYFAHISCIDEAYQAVQQAPAREGHITLVGGQDPNNSGKVVGIPSEWIDQLAIRCKDIVFVVEGDGSAGKSLKGHLAHEPIIPSSSSLVIPVIGIDSIGLKINVHSVHRPERICELTGAIADSVVTADIITKLLFHPQGYLNNCSEQNLIIPFINKVESKSWQQQAEKLAGQILASKHPQVDGVVVGSLLQKEGLWLQG